jgi:hypothetical protein
MKCPQCENNQKFSEGMTCGKCRYRFALNPKEPPNLSDMAVKKAIDQLSGPDELFFTDHQLYARLYRFKEKKDRSGRWGCGIVLLLILAVGGFFTTGIGVVVTAPIGILLLWWIVKRPTKIDHAALAGAIKTYRSVHPIDKLVEGRRFEDAPTADFVSEFEGYAPERILVVQRNDMADMLLLNRFHFDNKCLVVSKDKYPASAFAACRQFLHSHPDIPVQVMHDASADGLKMKSRLMKDPEWQLADRSIQDLGVYLHDAEKLKSPIWIPESGMAVSGAKSARKAKTARERVEAGFSMPVDSAPPRAMLGAVALAAVAGMALLSEDLLAEQQRHGGTMESGGYG